MPALIAIAQIRILPSTLVLVAALGLGACAAKNAALETDAMSTGSVGTATPAGAETVGSFKRTQELSQQ